MKMINLKRGSTFIIILLLINVSLLMWYFVFSNVFIMDNNLNVWNNYEKVFTNIFNAWNISIETVKKYNSNWKWYLDAISCPTNITMSWSTASWSSISSSMVYELWSIYCKWTYNSNEFRIYFNQDFSNFSQAFYLWDVVNLVYSSGTTINLWTTNIATSATVTWTTPRNWHLATHSNDWNMSTYFESNNRGSEEYLEYDLGSEKSIWEIIIKKSSHWWWSYWNNWIIELYNTAWTLLDTVSIRKAKKSTEIIIDFKFRWLTSDVRKVKLKTHNKRLDVKEFEIYELLSTGWENVWEWHRVFTDSDSTFISFDETWIDWSDDFDDDFNSDNYRVTSKDRIYYSNWFQDDDVIPRLFMFWNIEKNAQLYNIFWNNYKTNDFIDNNINNNDNLNMKISEVENWYMYLNLFSTDDIEYDMKIIKFDRDSYINEYTLLPLTAKEWIDIWNPIWFIQDNSWTLDLSTVMTWNEHVFDFKNHDYGIFITNKSNEDVSYKLNAISSSWTGVYINPIDDSFTGAIKVMSNNMIIWEIDKNYIWENFVITWSK